MKQPNYIRIIKHLTSCYCTYVEMVFIMMVLILTSVSCENKLSQIKQLSDMQNQPSMIAEGFEVITSDSTIIRYKMKTPQLISHQEVEPAYLEFPQGIQIEKYDDKMNITASIKANYAKQYVKDKKWEAKNNVIAVFENGDTLKTEELIWDENRQKIYTDQYFKIIEKDRYIIGVGLEADQNLSVWKIREPKGTFYMSLEPQ